MRLRKIEAGDYRVPNLLKKEMDSPVQAWASEKILFDFFDHENIINF